MLHGTDPAARAVAAGERIVWLDEEPARDATRVGGKAATLASLADQAAVPPGFCLTAASLAACCDGRLRPALRRALAAAYRRLGGGIAVPVAVRSSAVAEDGVACSFAGQYESMLGVAGEPALAAAVESCLAAAEAPRLAVYGGASGSPLAILVQRLIAADTAAVAFTADPVDGDRDVVVVEASWGLGDLLVGGDVDPDWWRLRKRDLRILGRRVGGKATTSALTAGGRRTVPVPAVLRRRPCLGDAQVTAIAELALRLEARTGRPVDVECCWAADCLYLLQCRPVTSLGGRGLSLTGGAA